MNRALLTQTSWVYALDTQAPQHLASRNLIDAGRAGQATLYVTSQMLCEFYAFVDFKHFAEIEPLTPDS